MHWHPQSPDLNSIEHLWDELSVDCVPDPFEQKTNRKQISSSVYLNWENLVNTEVIVLLECYV